MNKDNSHSWVRISHGLNKFVTDLIDTEYDDNEQEISETKTEVFALKTEVFAYASRSKAIAKPRRPTSACSFHKNSSYPVDYPVSKRLNTLLRHGESLREEDGAVEFWRLKDDLRNKFWVLSILVWWCMEEQDGRRRRQQEKISVLYWFFRNNSMPPSLSRSFRTQTHWSFFTGTTYWFRTISFENIYHIGCAVSVHSTNSGLIAGGQNSSKERQTVFFTAVNPMHKNHKDPQEFDLTKPRLASYKKKWKRHQDTMYWVYIQLAQRKGLKFYQTRPNAIILYDTLPAFCISKEIVMKSEESIYQKVFCVTSTTTENFLQR